MKTRSWITAIDGVPVDNYYNNSAGKPPNYLSPMGCSCHPLSSMGDFFGSLFSGFTGGGVADGPASWSDIGAGVGSLLGTTVLPTLINRWLGGDSGTVQNNPYFWGQGYQPSWYTQPGPNPAPAATNYTPYILGGIGLLGLMLVMKK